MSAEFAHRFEPAVGDEPVTLLLLHGTGGDENDLLDLGRSIHPTAALLSPRGKVLENGAPRFFRRLAEGVFDEADLIARTHELADFVSASAKAYQRDRSRIIAVGFSNGANIAASMLLLEPTVLRGAVLLRAMVPLKPKAAAGLHAHHVLISSGKEDPIVPIDQPEQLAEMLRAAGATVSLRWQEAGHGLTRKDLVDAQTWIQDWLPDARGA